MSTAKRARRRQAEAQSASPQPTPKRLKLAHEPHVPPKAAGLGSLIDEDTRAGKKLEAKLTNGVSRTKSNRVDESHAVVAPDTAQDEDVRKTVKPKDIISVSSADDSSSVADDSDDDSEGAEEIQNGSKLDGKVFANGHVSPSEAESAIPGDDSAGNVEAMKVGDQEVGEDAEALEEPTFGDLLQARHPQPIDVRESLRSGDLDHTALVPASGDRLLAPPSATSLGTVLTQALKTNDKDLLESCFRMNDLPSIRSTIQRLQSQHVATLLQRIAERIYKRPGRTGNLMVWIQWSLVAHGGYLATNPDVMRRLKALTQVVRDRASGLQPLLHLKGKLDMLSAQLELRRSMQASSRMANADEEDDEENVLYIEGEDHDSSQSDKQEDREHVSLPRSRTRDLKQPRQKSNRINADDAESDEDMPNGITQDLEDSSENDEEDEDRDGMLDIEAEEASEEEDEEHSSDEDDASDPSESDNDEISEDDGSEGDEVKPLKPNHLNRKR